MLDRMVANFKKWKAVYG